MLVLNDIHIGFRRSGGTTPASQETLRTYLFSAFRNTLGESKEKVLAIVGDLFDGFDIDPRDWMETFVILNTWLSAGRELILVAGNHDWSPKANRISSFEMLAQVLQSQHGEACSLVGIDEWAYFDNDCFLAHCSNQDVFNAKLDAVWAGVQTGDRVFIHANFDNNFAAQSDHSLNVSRDQAKAFHLKGATLYFAHEHQARTQMKGEVVVLGNQWPTSVMDCMNNEHKFAHVFHGSVTPIHTWSAESETGFMDVDWREIHEPLIKAGFYRVTGKASANEASEVINAIAKFRQKSEAFVITNAVKIEGITEADELPENFEAAKRFDVLDYIRQHMDADEMLAIEKLMVSA